MDNNQNVSIPAAEFKALMEQLSALTNRVKEVEDRRTPVDENTGGFKRPSDLKRKVTILFIDNKPVVGMRNQGSEQRPQMLIEKPDPNDPRRRVLRGDLLVKNLKAGTIETIKDVDFLEFTREADRKECVIIEHKRFDWLKEQGMVNAVEVKDYRTIEKDTVVPVDIVGFTSTYVVDIEGTPVEIHENYVNISK